MRHTPLFPELQITQEYLGRSVSLVYLLPMWRKTFLDFDTYCNGKGSTVSNIIAGKTFPSRMLGMAGVGNIGRSRNWTAHHFAQANWYAFGRLAWNPEESTESITSDWIKSTWNCDEATLEVIRQMMMLEHFIFPVYPESSPEWLTILDAGVASRCCNMDIR